MDDNRIIDLYWARSEKAISETDAGLIFLHTNSPPRRQKPGRYPYFSGTLSINSL